MGLLRPIFHRSAAAPPPRVIVNLVHDDPTRGDSRGYVGIGKRVAEKLGTRCDILDTQLMNERYPNESDRYKQLWREFNENGAPSIAMGTSVPHEEFLRAHGTKLIVDGFNETVTHKYSGLDYLAAHHITPSLLEAEGEKFRAAYPKQKDGPLVALMLAETRHSEDIKLQLEKVMREIGSGTIFICSSRRVRMADHKHLVQMAQFWRRDYGGAENFDIQGFHIDESRRGDFENEARYNPYAGLIDQADYILLSGSSRSMMSEPLAAGKPVHVWEMHYNYSKDFFKRGLSKNFQLTTERSLSDERFEPVNLTDTVADRIVQHYKWGRAFKPIHFMRTGLIW